jgi:RND family efflux transporter MFP subunit
MMRVLKNVRVPITTALLVSFLTGCNDQSAVSDRHASLIRTEVMQTREGRMALMLTGSVQARFRDELSFRVSGRVIERLVDVGQHVIKGQILARLDSSKEEADFLAATPAVAATEARLRLVKANLEHQKALSLSSSTIKQGFEQAQIDLRSAEVSLEAAQAQLGTARNALSYTELRADSAGLITWRTFEVGHVVQASQAVLSVARDGERDAVFEIPGSSFLRELRGDEIALRLVSNPAVTAIGHVRDISPVLSRHASIVRVKVTIENPPVDMKLDSAIIGIAICKRLTPYCDALLAIERSGSRPRSSSLTSSYDRG